MFQDPSGGRHALGVGIASQAYNQVGVQMCDQTLNLTGGDDKYSAALNSADPHNVFAGATIYDHDGTVYQFPSPLNHSLPNGGYTALPTTIEDRNGNVVNVTDLNNGAFKMTDTSGRTASLSLGWDQVGAQIRLLFRVPPPRTRSPGKRLRPITLYRLN